MPKIPSRLRKSLVPLLTAWTFGVYWVVLFVATHVPIQQPFGPRGTDKLVHFAAYGLLAFLAATAWTARRCPTPGSYLAIFLLLSIYGALDEVTQPLVGRTCDPADWLADVGGVAIGLGVFAAVRRLTAFRSPKAAD